jgi:hypothetical protein
MVASFIYFAYLKPLFFLFIKSEQNSQKEFTAILAGKLKNKYTNISDDNDFKSYTNPIIKIFQDFLILLESFTKKVIFEKIIFGNATAILPHLFGTEPLFDNGYRKRSSFISNFDLREALIKVSKPSSSFNTICPRGIKSKFNYINQIP